MGPLYITCYCRNKWYSKLYGLSEGSSLTETLDDATGISSKSVTDWKSSIKNSELKT